MLGEPRLVQGRAMRLAGYRREHPEAKALSLVPHQWSELVGISPLPGQLSEIGFGIRNHGAVPPGCIAYTAAVEVEDFDQLPHDVERITIPPARYAVFDRFDQVTAMRRAWPVLIDEWLPRSAFQPATTPSFERYDESFDPIMGRGGMAIWLAVVGGIG